jgi:hypothetical protein
LQTRAFDDVRKATAFIAELDNETNTKSVFHTMNPIRKIGNKRASSSDVTKRSFILVDLDPVRPSNTSSTGEQTELAQKKRNKVFHWLISKGVPADSILSFCSGNGYHINIRIDLSNDEEAGAIVNGVLRALGEKFDDETVKVDQACSDACRLAKVPGTWTRKGGELRTAGALQIGRDSGPSDPRDGGRTVRYQFWDVAVDSKPAVCPASVLKSIAGPAASKSGLTPAGQAATRVKSKGRVPATIADRFLRAIFVTAEDSAFNNRGEYRKSLASYKDLVGDSPDAMDVFLEFSRTDPAFGSQLHHDENVVLWNGTGAPPERDGPSVTYKHLLGLSNDRIATMLKSVTLAAFDSDSKRHDELKTKLDVAVAALDEVKAWVDAADAVPADDPDRLAEEFLEQLPEGRLGIRRHKGQWYQYQGSHFQASADENIRSKFASFIKGRFRTEVIRARLAWKDEPEKSPGAKPQEKRLTRSVMGDCMAALERHSLMIVSDESQEPPFWHDGNRVGSTAPFLSFQNGLLDQGALRQGVVMFREHTPEYFSTLAIPYAYDANAKCPQFLKMLRRATV